MADVPRDCWPKRELPFTLPPVLGLRAPGFGGAPGGTGPMYPNRRGGDPRIPSERVGPDDRGSERKGGPHRGLPCGCSPFGHGLKPFGASRLT